MSLRTALRSNAVFSGLSGLALAVASGPIASWIGLDASWMLVAVGLGLVGYAVQLLVTSRKEPIDPLEVKVAIGADLAWVVGSVVVVAWGPLTPVGETLVVAAAAVVLGFALLQARGLPRSDDRAGPPRGAALAVGLLAAAAPSGSAQDDVLSPMPPIDELRVLPTVNRRVRILGREAWREQTIRVNGAHREMGRTHHGRARVAGDRYVVEIGWTGTVRGEALDAPGKDRCYDYGGLGLLRIRDGRIERQILYADFRTLWEQLGDVVVR